MPKISEERREERRRQIMTAAMRCFRRVGYQRTSMTEIIAESGLSAGAIYGYFASKQELVRSVALWVMEGRKEELKSTSADHVLTPAEIASTLIRGLSENASTGLILQIWAEAAVDEELHGFVQGIVSGMRGTIEHHLGRWASAHPQLVGDDAADWAARSAPVLLALVPGFVLQKTLIDDFDEEGFFAAIPGFVHAEP